MMISPVHQRHFFHLSTLVNTTIITTHLTAHVTIEKLECHRVELRNAECGENGRGKKTEDETSREKVRAEAEERRGGCWLFSSMG